MVMGLIVGRLLDKFDRVLPLVLFLNLFQIIGSLMYFFGVSPLFMIFGRLIEGLGNPAMVAFTTDLCRATTLEERTPYLLLFNIAQQLGLLLGPACNLFLREIDFYIGSMHVNKLNAPGFFLFIVYALWEILAYFFYYDLKVAKEQESNDESDTSPILNQDIFSISQAEDALQEIRANPGAYDYVPWSRYIDELARGEIVALIFIRFIGLFGQTCLETIVTPMMKEYFNYDDFANSILYLSGGGLLILVFIALTLLSKKFSDRSMILVGLIMNIVTYIWFICTVPHYKPGDRSNLWSFAVGTVLDLVSIPILLDIGLSLYSKLLSDDVQGFGHAVRRFIASFAMFIGPIWGSGSLPWLNVLFSIPLVLLFVSSALFLASFNKMKPLMEEDQSAENTDQRQEITNQSNNDVQA